MPSMLALCSLLLPLSLAFQPSCMHSHSKTLHSQQYVPIVRLCRTMKLYGDKKRAWARGDLSDKDIFDDDLTDTSSKKDKFKLDPEIVMYDGPPAISEVFLPALSIITVLGVIPFTAAVARQVWVRYKFTSRRIAIQSGIGGKTNTEVIYPDVEEIKYVYRSFGAAGDMVLTLKDGAKVELRHVPKFEEIYSFVLGKCDAECQAKSMKLVEKKTSSPAV